MSFYRTALAAFATMVLATPVLADDGVAAAPQTLAENNAVSVEVAENNAAPVQVAENNAAPVQVAENNEAPVQVAENNEAPVQVAENNEAPVQVAESDEAPVQVAENSEAPMQVADNSMSGSDQTAMESAKVNVNKATVKELMKVKGMSAAKARAMVAYRKKHGDFKSLDDMKNVKGFKKMTDEQMKEMQDQLTV